MPPATLAVGRALPHSNRAFTGRIAPALPGTRKQVLNDKLISSFGQLFHVVNAASEPAMATSPPAARQSLTRLRSAILTRTSPCQKLSKSIAPGLLVRHIGCRGQDSDSS